MQSVASCILQSADQPITTMEERMKGQDVHSKKLIYTTQKMQGDASQTKSFGDLMLSSYWIELGAWKRRSRSRL